VNFQDWRRNGSWKNFLTTVSLAALTLTSMVLPNSYAATNIVEQPLSSVASDSSMVGLETALAGSLCEQPSVTQKELILPLLNSTKELGDIRVKIAVCSGQSNEVALLPLLDLISEYIDMALIAQLDKRSALTPQMTFRQLARHGVHLTFNDSDIVLQVDFSADIRKPTRYGLVSRHAQRINNSMLLPNAMFSGGLDYLFGQTWSEDSSNSYTVDLNGHLNIRGWVLQNQHIFANDRDQKWRRQSTLVTRDWPEKTLRLRLGDLNVKRIGFMGYQQLSGISLSTNFQLQPYSISYPISEQSFFLEQDAEVDVFVNGLRRDRRSLPAGAHNILDMDLTNGVNEVELKITDIYGRQQSILLSAFQNQTLLTPGKQEYSVTLGVPRSTGLSGLEYAYQSPGLSAFHRYGMTDTLTLGNWLQLSDNAITSGMTGLRSSIYGDFSGEIAVSRERQQSAFYAPAVRVGHRFYNQRLTLDTQWSWQHRKFATPGEVVSDNNIHHKLSVRLALPTIKKWRATFSVAHERRWEGESVFTKRLNMSRELGGGWGFTLNMVHYNRYSERESFISSQLSWRPVDSRHSTDMRYSSDEHKRSGNYNYRRDGELGFNMNADISESDSSQQHRANMSYASSHLDASFRVNKNQMANGQSSITKNASLGSSVVFADGHWAPSRQLSGQPFAIVNIKSNTPNTKIGVTKGSGTRPVVFLGEYFDASVLNNLSPYYVEDVHLDLTLAAAELQVKKESYQLKPTFLSATIVTVDAASGVYVTAKLIDSSGSALGYKVVNVKSIDGTEHVATFTDAFGFVVMEGLTTGQYRINVTGQPVLTALITIVDKQRVKVELGTLIMTKGDK
jgi:outer membrane usher protein